MIEEIQKAANVLESPTSSEDEKIDALTTIIDYVDSIDTANDFCKIGGLDILLPLITSEYPRIQSMSASLVAELAQNNPFCQKRLLDANVLSKLMSLLSEPQTATNGIHAISCLVRSYEPCLKAFTEVGGLECLLGCLQPVSEEKLIVKSLFLLSSLCADYPYIRDDLVKLGAVEQIISLLKPTSEYDVQLETALSTLRSLTDNCDAIARCKEVDVNLKETLEDIISKCGQKAECTEIVEYCQSLLQNVFNDSQADSTDR